MIVQKLNPLQFELGYEHLKSLTDEDKRLRFNASVTDAQIFNYCGIWNKPNHFVYGIFKDSAVIALLHIAPDIEFKNGWEIGISVIPSEQGAGLGSALMCHAKMEAENFGWDVLTFRYSESNRKLYALCNKVGFTTSRDGSEYLSYFELAPRQELSEAVPIVFD